MTNSAHQGGRGEGMKIKVTHSNGYSWYSEHVGEVFDVTRVAHHMRGDQTYTSFEVDLSGRHHDAIAGTINAKDCQVVDWTDAPQSMEVERLTSERDDLAARVKAQTIQIAGHAMMERQLRQAWQELAGMTLERDDALAKLKAAQAELDDLRIRVGLGSVSRVVELAKTEAWAKTAYTAIKFTEGIRPVGLHGLLELAPDRLKISSCETSTKLAEPVTSPTPSGTGR